MDPEKNSLNFIFPTKYVIPKSLSRLVIGQVSTLPETNSSHLEMDGWNTSFLLGWPIFRGELLVSGRVYI